MNEVCVLIENSKDTSFLKDVWIGSSCLIDEFPILFLIFNNKCSSMENIGIWDGFTWI